MVVDDFLRAKKGRLERSDKSNIGEMDESIVELCRKINNSDDYYTLSSCGGRIVLIRETEDKQAGLFIFRSHCRVEFSRLKKVLEGIRDDEDEKGLIYLKQEPCVLAVSCRNLEVEQELLNKARACGWKKSGITTTSRKFVVELFSTERIDVPIMDKGNILVDDDYLKLVVDEANSKLERTWNKIERLKKEMR